MHFKALYILVLFPVFLCGCFDLVEELNLHADGSGTYLFEANLSQSKTKLNALLALDSVDGYKIPTRDQLLQDMNKAHNVLAASEGITMVTDKSNLEDYIFSMQFEFKNIACLNKALWALYKAFPQKEHKPMTDVFKWEGNTFTRINEYEGKAELKKLPRKDSSLLDKASITCIYRFEKEVKQASNPDSKIAKNGKAVFLKLPLADLLSGKKKLANTILIQN